MRRIKHEIRKVVGDDLHITMHLVHHQASESEEVHEEELGWEVTALTFALDPDTECPFGFTLKQPIAKMMHIRGWVAGFSLDSIAQMISIYSTTLSGLRRIEFNRVLLEIDESLVELDKAPSFSFDT